MFRATTCTVAEACHALWLRPVRPVVHLRRTRTHIYVCMFVCMCVYVVYVCMCVCVCVCVCVFMFRQRILATLSYSRVLQSVGCVCVCVCVCHWRVSFHILTWLPCLHADGCSAGPPDAGPCLPQHAKHPDVAARPWDARPSSLLPDPVPPSSLPSVFQTLLPPTPALQTPGSAPSATCS